MNCIFCNQKCENCDSIKNAVICYNHPSIDVYYYAHYLRDLVWNMLVMSNGIYRVHIYNREFNGGNLFYLYEYDERSTKHVLTLSENPNLTPKNFDNKIKTLIVFS